MNLYGSRSLAPSFIKLASKSCLNRRCFATTGSLLSLDANQTVTDIAILGGGITGLTSAFYASERFPTAKISVFEGSDRLGGWIRSSKIDVNGGHVIFEHGPRNLRSVPSTVVILDLVSGPQASFFSNAG